MAKIKIKDDPKLTGRRAFNKQMDDFVESSRASVVNPDYIVKYATENTKQANKAGIYSGRLARTYPMTLTPSILQQHVSTSAQPLTVQGFDDARLEGILKDVTGFDESAKDMLAMQLAEHYTKGFHVILVEKDSEVSESLAAAQASGERPYQILYKSSAVPVLRMFRSGKRRGEVREIVLIDAPEDIEGKSYEVRRRYFYEGENENYTFQLLRASNPMSDSGETPKDDGEIEFDIVQENLGTLSKIPAIPCGNGPASAVLRQVLYLDQGLLNRLSIYSNVNYNQGFQRATFFGVKESEVSAVSEFTASFVSNPSGKVELIPPGDPTAIENEIKMLIRQIIRIGLFEFRAQSDDSKESPSAGSKQMDFKHRVAFYNDTLDRFQRKLTAVYQLMAEFQGVNPDEVKVRVGRDFELTDSEFDLAVSQIIDNMAQRYGEAGENISKHVLGSLVTDMDVVVNESQEEEEIRGELIEALMAAQVSEQAIERFSISDELVNGDPNTATI